MFLSVLLDVAPLIFVLNSRSKCSAVRCSYRLLVLRVNITLMFLVPTYECYADVFLFLQVNITLTFLQMNITLNVSCPPQVNITLMFLVPHR